MSLLPPDDDLDLIHTRRYETRVYFLSDSGVDALLVRGAVSDTKPPGLYVVDDAEEVEIHQMQLELRVSLPKLVIEEARVLFETHPHAKCPFVAPRYEQLVGVSIARGFNRTVRELFGGDRGCTHTNALLQAMAPAVIQATWSVSIRAGRAAGQIDGIHTAPDRESKIAANMNTCHVWSETGEHVERLRRGDASEFPPLPVKQRLKELGRDPERWD